MFTSCLRGDLPPSLTSFFSDVTGVDYVPAWYFTDCADDVANGAGPWRCTAGVTPGTRGLRRDRLGSGSLGYWWWYWGGGVACPRP